MSFRIRTKKNEVSESIKRISRSFNNDAFEIISNGMTDTVLEAKATHRFTARSGNLERSVISEMKRSDKDIQGSVLLKDSIALYGKYIHNGFKSWSPDPFLRISTEKFFPLIINEIKAKIEQLIQG